MVCVLFSVPMQLFEIQMFQCQKFPLSIQFFATVQASYTKILGGRRKVIDTLISSEYRPTPQYVDLFLKDCFCSLKLAARKFGVQSYLTI